MGRLADNGALGEAVSLRVETDLGHGFVRLLTAEAERRQAAHDIRSCEDVIIELLRNARDAQARRIFLATSRELDERRIVVIDDGAGVPQELFSRIFEPRVTSKLDTVHMDKWGVHGRGMALYSIVVNAKSAAVADSAEGGGTSIVVDVDGRALKERKDQSTFPVFRLDASTGSVAVTGPRNIVRTACEFAMDSRGRYQVFFGSPTEIAAALYAAASPEGRSAGSLGANPRTAPLCERLRLASGPEEFASVAAGLGLRMSARSARRIIDGLIEPPLPLAELIARQLRTDGDGSGAPASVAEVASDGKGAPSGSRRSAARSAAPRISDADLEAFGDRVADAFEGLADSYYLSADVRPSVKVSRGELVVRIPLA